MGLATALRRAGARNARFFVAGMALGVAACILPLASAECAVPSADPVQIVFTPEDAESASGMRLRVLGPNGFIASRTFPAGVAPAFPFDDVLLPLADGGYSWELVEQPTPSPEILNARVSALEGGAAVPAPVVAGSVQRGTFAVTDGSIVFDAGSQAGISEGPMTRDAVTVDDSIIQGSLCVGFDCVNGEDFQADTIRLKENNLRIHFDDTSSTGSFPYNDWRIMVNDQANGGANHFSIDDATAGMTPFRIMAGAPTASLHVASSGNVGVGTSTPATDVHIASGDSPSMRLEQNGTGGFAAQTWDAGGNEVHFFVRDVTSSKYPLMVKAGAPTKSLVVAPSGLVGLGTALPQTSLHVVKSDTPAVRLDQPAGSFAAQAWEVGGNDFNYFVRDVTNAQYPFQIKAGAPTKSFFMTSDGKIGLGTKTPAQRLHVQGNVYVSGSVEVGSSRSLKHDIAPLPADAALDALRKLTPVTYRYNATPEELVAGFIAEDVPDLLATESRSSIAPMDFVAVLAKVAQEQQALIERQQTLLETQRERLAEQDAAIDQLARRLGRIEQQTATSAADPGA